LAIIELHKPLVGDRLEAHNLGDQARGLEGPPERTRVEPIERNGLQALGEALCLPAPRLGEGYIRSAAKPVFGIPGRLSMTH